MQHNSRLASNKLANNKLASNKPMLHSRHM